MGKRAVELKRGSKGASKLGKRGNDERQKRPMRTGMMLKFKGELIQDGPSGLADACQRLFGETATWSSAEREAVGRFLQQHIKDVRDITQYILSHKRNDL